MPSAEGINPNLRAESTVDGSDVPPKGAYVRAMAPPPMTPAACSDAHWGSAHVRLPKTPRLDAVFEPQAEGEHGKDTGSQPEPTPTPPEATAATSHQAHEMLRRLTDIVDAASLNPEEPSSILYRAKALSTILDTTIVPRMMKVDKDVNDIVWMR